MLFSKEGVPDAYKVLLVITFTGVAINVVMNTFWGYLVCKGLKKVLIGKKKSEQESQGKED